MRLEHDWFSRELPANVVIGQRSWLYSGYAFLHYRSRREVGVVVGSDTGVYHGTFFELGEHGHVVIGDYCTLVGPKIVSNGSVVFGNHCLIAHDVMIATTAFALPPNDAMPPVHSEPDVAIVFEDNVWVGAGAIVLGGAHLGANSIVAAGAVVDFAVPPNAIVAGNPAQVVGWARAR